MKGIFGPYENTVLKNKSSDIEESYLKKLGHKSWKKNICFFGRFEDAKRTF